VIEATNIWLGFLPLLNWVKGFLDEKFRVLSARAAIEMFVKEEYRDGPRSKRACFANALKAQ